jgi:hypothetical protein
MKAKKEKKAKVAKAQKERVERTDTFKAILLKKMERVNGITLADILEMTKEFSKQKPKAPWKTPSVHGYISNLISKGGYKIESFKPENGERTYRIKG